MRYKLMSFKLLENVVNMRRLTLPLTGGTTTLFLPVVKFAIFDSFSASILFPMYMYMYIVALFMFSVECIWRERERERERERV
ncbi:hypothetical protein HYC85_017183 [Camellia sinensis]|uniref:Uncharacterized protein n=1 Tax=Camellia sinensis TaxID=4442 RepID=A0A7J7H324_CAMSI|nr:hypothetical protein HYC85_017183 [Camellia sinensis]